MQRSAAPSPVRHGEAAADQVLPCIRNIISGADGLQFQEGRRNWNPGRKTNRPNFTLPYSGHTFL